MYFLDLDSGPFAHVEDKGKNMFHYCPSANALHTGNVVC